MNTELRQKIRHSTTPPVWNIVLCLVLTLTQRGQHRGAGGSAGGSAGAQTDCHYWNHDVFKLTCSSQVSAVTSSSRSDEVTPLLFCSSFLKKILLFVFLHFISRSSFQLFSLMVPTSYAMITTSHNDPPLTPWWPLAKI